MASLMPTGKQQFFDSPNGRPLAGGKLYTYAVGTTTPKATYSDAAGNIQNSNPIILDSRGEALIFWSGSYDVVLKDANDNLIYSVSNYATDAAAKVLSDLAAPSGASLVGLAVSNTLENKTLDFYIKSNPIPLESAISGEMVNDGSVNYSEQFQKVLDYMRDYGGGKIILPPNCTIKAGNLRAYTGVEIFAHDWSTIIDVPAGMYGISVNPGTAGSSDITLNQRNIAFRGFKLRGQVSTAGFSEQVHLLNLNGLSFSEIDHLCIEGFQGDGIYLGSSNDMSLERHNSFIKVIGGRIDGVNKDNRNGISVIDCDTLDVYGVDFRNTTRTNMPGAIDIEPENSFNVVKDINVDKCKFKNIGGTSGVVSYNANGYLFTTPSNNIRFSRNDIDTCDNANGAFACQVQGVSAGSTSAPIDFEFSDNVVRNTNYAGVVVGSRGVRHIRNKYIDINRGLYLGLAVNGGNYDVKTEGNRYLRVGSANAADAGYGVQVSTNSYLTIARERFEDVGRADGTFGYAIYFVDGTSDNVVIDGNEVLSPNAKTTYGIKKLGTHTLTPETNRFGSNKIGASGNDFQWKAYDYAVYTAADAYTGLPEGWSASSVSGDVATPTVQGKGLLVTHKFRDPTNLNYAHTTLQWFYPTDSDTTGGANANVYFRKISRTTGGWQSWLKLAGV